jgi:NADPH:quinone reductase-like Zn-dependent oxidoreductase
MRALVLDRFGVENLRVTQVPDPSADALAEDAALLRVHATSLNHRDLLVVRGKYDPRFSLPLVPCSDAVATVLATGSSAHARLVGKRVMPAMAPHWLSGPPTRNVIRQTLGAPLHGTACELIVVPASALVEAPEHLDGAEAATLPCAATTAYRALFELGGGGSADAPTWAGVWVLCQGTGGVSLFALQMAKAVGASVAVTSSSDEKLELARRLGADITLNYQTESDWGRKIRDLTGGVSHVIEVGGPGTLERSLKACLPGATISMIGSLAAPSAPVDLLPAVMSQIRIQGVYVGPRDTLERTAAFFARHRLKPQIDRVYSLSEASDAFRDFSRKTHAGKLCITI